MRLEETISLGRVASGQFLMKDARVKESQLQLTVTGYPPAIMLSSVHLNSTHLPIFVGEWLVRAAVWHLAVQRVQIRGAWRCLVVP